MTKRPADRSKPDTAQATDDVLRRFMGYKMKRAYLVVEAVVNAVLHKHDLRVTSFSALGIIIENPGLTQTALAAALQIERSSVVVIVDTLEDRELITRNKVEGDRRTYALMSTLRGRRLFEQIASEIEAREGALQAALDDGQQAALSAFLRSIETGGGPLDPAV